MVFQRLPPATGQKSPRSFPDFPLLFSARAAFSGGGFISRRDLRRRNDTIPGKGGKTMYSEQPLAAADKHRLRECAIRFLLAAILSGSQIFGGYAPFGLGLVAAAGAGMEGLSALLGLLVGSLLFQPFTDAMKYIAAAVLIFSVSVAFFDTKLYRKTPFLPLAACACTAAVGFVYLTQPGLFSAQGAYSLLEVFLAGASAACYRVALARPGAHRSRRELLCLFALALSLLIAVAAIPLVGELSLGRILAVVLVLAAGRIGGLGFGCAAGLGAGLAMDTVSGGLYFAVSYSLSAAAACLKPCGRALYTLLFLGGTVFSLFWASGDIAVYALLETAVAGLVFLLLPEKLFRKRRADTPETGAPLPTPRFLESQLRSAAAVFRDLYDSLSRSKAPVNDENIATVFDRAADQICRACPLCGTCWDSDYVTTYNALNDVTGFLTERGRVLPSDFPSHFSSRCIRLPDFIAAVNAEFTALLMRRQYTRQLDDTRQSAKEQYARLSELLNESADQIGRGEAQAVPAAGMDAPACELCTAMRPKAGESVSGDTVSTFRTEDGRVFLLLSDGMGCGEDARRESAMTVRLLEQFLKAGIEPSTALKTLNAALALHSDENGSFTTIDLMVLSPREAAASFYKYGAAPSYIKHGTAVRRITGSVLPAGLNGSRTPDATNLCLLEGDFVILASDGFVDAADDAWLQAMLAQWDEPSVQALTTALMDASTRRSGRADDASLLVLRLPQRPAEAV